MPHLVRRWISILAGLVITLVLLIALVFYLAVRFMPFQAAQLEKVHQPSVVYASDGSKLMTLGSQNTDLTYQQIPKNLQNAIVATEDHTFWTNSGIDIKSVFRSAFVDVFSGSLAQGASTIPEQLAKITYLTANKTFSRKFQQIILGVQINRNFTKQEILAMYLNRVPLGESSTGADQGALRYFGIDLKKNPNQLTLPQAALLAGLPQAPSAYDPLQHPKAALARRNQVLENMAHWGYISEAQAQQAEQAPLGVKFHSFQGDGWDSQPLLTNFLLDYLNKHKISPDEVQQGGLQIYTTISPAVQNAVNQVFWSGQYDSDFPGPTSGTVVQGAGIFVDPKTGGILGAAGSRKQGYTSLGLDRIYSSSSPGSSIKPIMDYAPAIESGKWSYTSVLNNAPQDFGGGYTPHNWNASGPSKVTLQYGIEWSQNIASVWLLQQIGLKTGADFAAKDGIPLTSSDYNHLGIAIGGLENGVTPMDMVGAYTPFANQGVRSQPYLITKIVNAQGTEIYQESPSQKQVMTADTADKMTRLMQDVVDFGTGQSAKLANWGVAGKTGTVQYDTGLNGSHPNWIRDGWFDGYTPTIVGSIHIGYDHSSPTNHMTMSPVDPSANAAKLFHDVIALALQNQQPQQFANGPYPYVTGTADGVNYVQQQQQPSQSQTSGLQGLQASYDPAKNQVTLNWSGGFPTTVAYTVMRQTMGTGSTDQQTPVGQTTGTSLVDTNVQPNQVYQYTVQATDPNSGQPLGNPVSTTVATGNVTPPGQGQGDGGGGQVPPGNGTGPAGGGPGDGSGGPGGSTGPGNGPGGPGSGGPGPGQGGTGNGSSAPTGYVGPGPGHHHHGHH
ncbi:transglycosylase domain-containing protein [Alicyclobacillus dauci]|uniref:Transglycosylase domain-containing protein n=1 Tax=Alicyclobacillus dauci TaxID=1475485 RepID=A0ABY6Z273_9BACL|nr:transglycosylase domain-containing protein [Alicyclobacillus dauci]WAH36703.1 transglycosylase domain-containing protein [Alicyclobacillus dauci]